jgi:pyridoxine 5-phosphate synthase
MAELGVNIDHVATIRQARKTYEPDPVWAAAQAELGGADGITVHLREDRRHIQDRDVRILRETVTVKLNLEMACLDEMVRIATEIGPDQISLVPEKREEITTEGGLDVIGQIAVVSDTVKRLRDAGILVSLFIDPNINQVEASAEIGAEAIELHTGEYANAKGKNRQVEFDRLLKASARCRESGMKLHAGHGLNYQNVRPVAEIEGMHELNIGHSIVSRAVFVGFQTAVREMKQLVS